MAGSWRDRIKVHPAADMFPMMSDAECDELAKDIAAHGLKVPPRWSYDASGELAVCDGRNRLEAIDRISDEATRSALWKKVFESRDDMEVMVEDPYTYVMSLNVRRRHLTAEQKRDLIVALLKAAPERSDRATAKIAKVDGKTVATVRTDMERRAEIPHVEARIDTAGRMQRASKLHADITAPDKSEKIEPIALSRADLAEVRAARPNTLIQISTLAHIDTGTTIKELIRVLNAVRADIAALPEAQRIADARGFLRALSVTTAQLQIR